MVSHQPTTKSHIWSGNWLYGARGGKYRSRSESEQVEPRNIHHVEGRYCSLRSRQQSYNRYRQGYENSTGSKMTARYYRELT